MNRLGEGAEVDAVERCHVGRRRLSRPINFEASPIQEFDQARLRHVCLRRCLRLRRASARHTGMGRPIPIEITRNGILRKMLKFYEHN